MLPRLVCIEPLHFTDGTLPVGEVFESLTPTAFEAAGELWTLCPNRSVTSGTRFGHAWSARQWVVIEWKGLRRALPMRAFRAAGGR
jgi:hypothetical protein